MTQSRRDFIRKISIASASLLPVSDAVSSALEKDYQVDCQKLLEKSFNESLEFHVVDNNLLNLHFYFINTRRKGRFLRPNDYSAPSFMIVRLPQMHISEKGFWAADWTDSSRKHPAAVLSGFSYLAFELWPVPNRNFSKLQLKKRQF